jgi:hypothetical protein
MKDGWLKFAFNTRLVFMHLITQYMERLKNGPPGRMFKKRDFTLNQWFVINIEEKIPVVKVLIFLDKKMYIS